MRVHEFWICGRLFHWISTIDLLCLWKRDFVDLAISTFIVDLSCTSSRFSGLVRYVAWSIGNSALRIWRLSFVYDHSWFRSAVHLTFNLGLILKFVLSLKFNSLFHHVLQYLIILLFLVLLCSRVTQYPTLHLLILDVLSVIIHLEPLLFWIIIL